MISDLTAAPSVLAPSIASETLLAYAHSLEQLISKPRSFTTHAVEDVGYLPGG